MHRMVAGSILSFLLASAANAAGAESGSAPDGEKLFAENCLTCHDGGAAKAPHVVILQVMSPESLLETMVAGAMKAQSAHLDEAEKVAVAEYLGGRPISTQAVEVANFCSESRPAVSGESASVTGWGMGASNPRSVPGEVSGINRDNASSLKLKWAYAFPGSTRVRSQPTVHGGVIYTGSQDGRVYAIDFDSGCTHWVYSAEAEVRSAVSVHADDQGDVTLYFGDFNGQVYALNGRTGEAIWVRSVNDHPDVTITGSPKLHEDTLYVPMSSREWATAADPFYACCTFRGGVVAFDRHTGEIRWKNHVVGDEPAETGEKTARGTPILAPSGAPVWNSPSIDEKRGVLYVGTGEAYSSPAHGASDAVVAFDLKTGERRWVHQALAGDAWNMSCNIEQRDNCPKEDGPDFDIGAATIVHRDSEGRHRVLAGQKSGDVFALDPDAGGKLLWKTSVGRGGFYGGVHWGMAVDPRRDVLYAPIADTDINDRFEGQRRTGLYALDIATGEVLWEAPTALACPEGASPMCDPGLSAAVTATEGVVFAGALDGTLRGYDSNTGEVIWEFDTVRDFDSVSGVDGFGGAIESDGPVLINGSLLINSGYLWGGRLPGNVLLRFSVDQ